MLNCDCLENNLQMTIELEKTKKRLYNSERANFNHKLNLKKGNLAFLVHLIVCFYFYHFWSFCVLH